MKAKKQNSTGKRRIRKILLAVLLIVGLIVGFSAYQIYVVHPREQRAAVDDLIRCLKKSDAYESADDFRLRLSDYDYDYEEAVISDYGYRELADYFDKLYQNGDYHEYIHDASVMQKNDYIASLFIRDSALAKLWEMGSPIGPDDVYEVTEDSYAADPPGVYFRGVRIDDYDIVQNTIISSRFLNGGDEESYCRIRYGRVYGSIFVWPVKFPGNGGWGGYIVIDSDNGNYFSVCDFCYTDSISD